MTHKLLLNQHFLRVELSGALSRDGLWRAITDIEVLEASLDRTPDRLVDLSGITSRALTAQDMMAFTERRRAQVLKNNIRTAVFAATPADIGFARMFQTLNDHPQVTIEVFADELAAIAWLTRQR